MPAVIEQKVTGQEAFSGYRSLVRRYGTAAPGPAEGLLAPPTAAGWAAIPSWAWLQASVDGARSRTVVRAAGFAGRLEEAVGLGTPEAHRRMRALPGIGVWTAAEVAQRALGDAEAVSFGDYHVAKDIGWTLTGTPVDDDGLAELLEPYAGHLLLDDRRGEGVEEQARAGHPPERETAPGIGDRGVHGLEARGVVVVTEQRGHGVEEPPPPGAPRVCVHLGARCAAYEMDRADALRGLGGTDDGAVGAPAHRGVAGPATEHSQLGPQIDLAVGAPDPAERTRRPCHGAVVGFGHPDILA